MGDRDGNLRRDCRDDDCPGRWGRLSTLSVFLYKSVFYGAFGRAGRLTAKNGDFRPGQFALHSEGGDAAYFDKVSVLGPVPVECPTAIDLMLYLHLDEESGSAAADATAWGNDGATEGTIADGKFCRGRDFTEDGPQGVSVPTAPSLEFGSGSFSVTGWARHRNYTYPRTGFVAKNGHGCYFHKAEEHESGVERVGWNPGWEVGHGYIPTGANVCIRDSDNNKARANLDFDAGSQPQDLLGQWVHYAFVFDRTLDHRVYAYVNGARQANSLDISGVPGSVDNGEAFTIGTLYGWKTDGTLDDYRLYARAVSAAEVAALYGMVPTVGAGCGR
jgi:hypothetical protein